MIPKQEIMALAAELQLQAHVVEKDYALGWFLAGIAAHPVIGPRWVFKGGTCLKKCYFETYRFSEDLDFTLQDAEHLDETFLAEVFAEISDWVYDACGLQLPPEARKFEVFTNPRGSTSAQGRDGYRGPLGRAGDPPRIKLDLATDEVLVLSPVQRPVHHPYSDLPEGGIHVLSYSFEEVFAEKMRALAERQRPRDLYDVVHLYRRQDLQADRALVRSQPFDRAHVSDDLFGDAYEYLIRNFASKAGKSSGEFYTPAEVGFLMAEVLQPKAGLSICDWASGSGGLLLQCIRHVNQHGGDVRQLQLHGQESNVVTYNISRINMILHGIPVWEHKQGDSLRDPRHLTADNRLKQFDRVIMNPPFSLEDWGYDTVAAGDKFGRLSFGMPPTSNGDWAWLQQIVKSLKDADPETGVGGQGVVVMSQGMLFRGQPAQTEAEDGQNQKADAEYVIRRGFIEADLIEAIIVLPGKLFYGNNVPGCLVLLNKAKPTARKDKILMIWASRHFQKGNPQNLLRPSDLMRVLVPWRAFGDLKAARRRVCVMRVQGVHPLYWAGEKYQPPADWPVKPIGDYATVVKGKLPLELFKEPQEGSLPYLLIDGLGEGESLYTNETHLPTIEESDTVVVADGSRSGLAIRGIRGILGSTLLAYGAKVDVDPVYLFYVLESLYPYNNTATIGGAIPHLDKRLLAMLTLATPEPDEQRRIAAALKLADDAINKARVELAATRDLKRSLEAGLIVGQPDRKQRSKIVTKAGALPNDWTVLPLKDLADIGSGVTLNQDRAPKENGCRYLTVAHVQRGTISNQDARYLELSEEERQTRLLETGDILVIEGHANAMEIGRAAIFEDQGVATTFQNHLFRVRADGEQILSKFLLYVLNSERVQRLWNATCNSSSGLNTINRRSLRRVWIQRPSLDEQRDIVETLDAAENNVAAAQMKVTVLEDVKRSLLQNLLTGKIRIPEGAVHA